VHPGHLLRPHVLADSGAVGVLLSVAQPSPAALGLAAGGDLAAGKPAGRPFRQRNREGERQEGGAEERQRGPGPGGVGGRRGAHRRLGDPGHFAYAGNVTLPVGGGGSVSMMKFTADSITLAGSVTDTVTQSGTTTVTSSPTLAFSGGVTLYATKLTGSLLGVPLTFTPSTVSAVLLTIASVLTSSATITMTNVTTDQPVVIAGALQTGQLSIG